MDIYLLFDRYQDFSTTRAIVNYPTVKCNETPITRRYTEHPRQLKKQLVAHICDDITSSVKLSETTIGNKNRLFQGGASFVDHLRYFCLVFVMLSCASVYCCIAVTCWERADLLALVCDV